MSNDAEAFLPRRLRAKPPPIDLSVVTGNGSTPNRIQFWSAAQQRVAPELGLSGPGSPTPLQEDGLSPGIALSPLFGEGPEGGWAGLPAHVLELIFAALRDSQGRWPSRKVLFSVCGACKLWRRVGHTLFFSNVWHHHSDVIVHPSQLFTLSPHPLPLPTSDHLLRCFVHRTPCTSPGMSPRLSRLWRFALYLGSDHKSLMRFRSGPGSGSGAGGLTGGLGLSGGGTSASSPQLLMIAQQTGRRCYQLILSPATASGPVANGRGNVAAATVGWRTRRALGGSTAAGAASEGRIGSDSGGAGASGQGGSNVQGGWNSPQLHLAGGGGGSGGPRASSGTDGGGGGGRRDPSSHDSGVVAVLRSNIRCSHYELIPDSFSPWARRLISLAGYMGATQGGTPQPLIQLEYRLRVRGIMLPRRMKVQVPVPHSLQRIVHNPLYDLHEPMADGLHPTAVDWPSAFGPRVARSGAGAAVIGPPAPGAAVPPGPAVGGGGGVDALPGDVLEGLMDNLEDILEAAMRTEPLLFANMVDAMVRPADDDDAGGGDGGGQAARGGGVGGGRAPSAGAVHQGASALRRFVSLGGGFGSSLLRGFLLNRMPAGVDGAGGQPPGGTVQWWGSDSLGSHQGSGGRDSGNPDAVGGWALSSPQPSRVVQLQNKAPHWNDALLCWCLNFRGRVKMASVKNFQLMCSADKAERCVMQFGKVEEGIYILDFNPCVLTAAQAFAAALSTFETKYLL